VYLSRSHLNPRRKRLAKNETAVEAFLVKHGFTVIHPQELPIPDQVAIMRNAEAIAGCDGSGLHMSAFARPGTKLLAIDSRTVPNQFLIDQARGLDSLHVLAVREALDERSASWRIQIRKVKAAVELLFA
jgi:capsular polysaccharide biosynthesis protein